MTRRRARACSKFIGIEGFHRASMYARTDAATSAGVVYELTA